MVRSLVPSKRQMRGFHSVVCLSRGLLATLASNHFQKRLVFSNLNAALAAANHSLRDVVKTTVYLKNSGDFPEMIEIVAIALCH